MILIGLIVLLAAVIVGVAGVAENSGSTHSLTNDFTVLGYDITGSTGTLFLYGIVVGAVGAFGLSLLLAGAVRNSRRARHARRELQQNRREGGVGQGGVQPVAAPMESSRRTWRHPFGGTSTGPTVAPR